MKYAIVRVQGKRMVDLFSLLVSHGFSDVSFVSSLAHTVLKTDTSPSQEDASTSRVSSSSAAVGSGGAATAAAAESTTTSGLQQQHPTTPQQPQPQLQHGRTSKTDDSSSSSPAKTNAADLLQSLFERNTEEDGHAHFSGHNQPWVLPTGEIPAPGASLHAQPMMMPMGLMPAGFGGPDFGAASQSVRSMNYSGIDGTGRKMPFIVRMKGWQRKMLNEAMAIGIPTGAELRDLCVRCQVTETQAIRFFRKRKYGQAGGDGSYQMEDDGDGMRGDSPEEVPQYQEPKMEDVE